MHGLGVKTIDRMHPRKCICPESVRTRVRVNQLEGRRVKDPAFDSCMFFPRMPGITFDFVDHEAFFCCSCATMLQMKSIAKSKRPG